MSLDREPAIDPIRAMLRESGREPTAALAPALAHARGPQHHDVWMGDGRGVRIDLHERARRDVHPLPSEADREGYYPGDAWAYWTSGLVDFERARFAFAARHGDRPARWLDLGCASGRVIRHALADAPDWTVFGCDIDRAHVDWCRRHLPQRLCVFQNTTFPHLPLPDASLDLVTAYSVFTHLDKLEDFWLLELRRVLAPGGLALLSVHTENVWRRMRTRPAERATMLRSQAAWSEPAGLTIDDALLDGELPHDRMVLRFQAAGAYVAQTFHSIRHVREVWSRYLHIVAIHDGGHGDYQDLVVLRR